MTKYSEKGTSQEVETIIDLRKDSSVKIEGVYQGMKVFDSKRPGETTTLHYFKVGDKVIGAWGAKDLNDKLAGEEGKQVCVNFKEKMQLKDGRSKNIFCVQVAQ